MKNNLMAACIVDLIIRNFEVSLKWYFKDALSKRKILIAQNLIGLE